MDIFKRDRHNYWNRHITQILMTGSLNQNNMLLTNQYARDLLLLIQELKGNEGHFLYSNDLDFIPVDAVDMQAARFVMNQYYQSIESPRRITMSGGGIMYG
jgi:hypothetical protein